MNERWIKDESGSRVSGFFFSFKVDLVRFAKDTKCASERESFFPSGHARLIPIGFRLIGKRQELIPRNSAHENLISFAI